MAGALGSKVGCGLPVEANAVQNLLVVWHNELGLSACLTAVGVMCCSCKPCKALEDIYTHLGAVVGTSLQWGSASAPVLVQTSILVALESA